MNPVTRRFSLVPLLVMAFAGVASAGEPPVAVPGESLMQRHYIDVEPIRADPVLKWKVKSLQGAAKEEWTNCIVHKGVMYGSAQDIMHAIDVETGKVLWTVSGPGGHPAIQGDRLYAAGYDRFYAIDLATGKVQYETPCTPMLSEWAQAHGFMKPAVVIADGVAFCGAKSSKSLDSAYHAIDLASGRLLWQAKPGNEAWTARPTVGGGRLYGSSHRDPVSPTEPGPHRRPEKGEAIVAMDAKTGAILWRREGVSTASNPVYQDEVVYVGLENAIEALDAKTGAVLWNLPVEIRTKTKRHPEGGAITGLALHDKVLIASGAGATLLAVGLEERKTLWTFKQEEVKEIITPLICRDVVLVTTAGQIGGEDPSAGGRTTPIYGLDLKTGRSLWKCLIPGTDCLEHDKKAFNSYVCGWAYPDGRRICMFSFTGFFYCFEQP